MSQPPSAIPRSISHWLDPFIAIAVLIAVYLFLRDTDINNLFLAIAIVVAVAAVMGLIEFYRAPWSPLYRLRKHSRTEDTQKAISETSLQWLGMLSNFLIILFLWWTLAEYYRDYYKPFFAMLPLLILAAPIVTALGLFATEKLVGASERGGRELGLLLVRVFTGYGKRAIALARWRLIRDEFFSWLLFGFFLPINFVELVNTIATIRGQELALLFSGDWIQTQYAVIIMIYGGIIGAITPGYLFGSRLIRTETRAVDHSWFGWTVTLICYDPIVTAVFGRWFDYRVAVEGPLWARPWATIFQDMPALLFTIGGIIIFCELLHLWGEAQFGLRSSNISNRGVITAGPYRFTKHPVYVSKLAGWFFMWIPFIAGGNIIANLRLTLLWGCVGVIYALRALAEERLLAKDPVYVEYALYMDTHSIFAWVGKLLPIMSFEYRLRKWRAQEIPEIIVLPQETAPAIVTVEI